MSIDEIREYAPEGATHYIEWYSHIFNEWNVSHHKVIDGVLYDMVRGKWEKSIDNNISRAKPL